MSNASTGWRYAPATGGIVDTTAVVIAAAQVGRMAHLEVADISNGHATVGTVVQILDGTTVIWQGFFGAVGAGARPVLPKRPLKSTSGAALSVKCVTSGAAVYVNAEGFYE